MILTEQYIFYYLLPYYKHHIGLFLFLITVVLVLKKHIYHFFITTSSKSPVQENYKTFTSNNNNSNILYDFYVSSNDTCPTLTCPVGYNNVNDKLDAVKCECAPGYQIGENLIPEKFNKTCVPVCTPGHENVYYEKENRMVCAPICNDGYKRVEKEDGKFVCEIICRHLNCPDKFHLNVDENTGAQSCVRT